jgi:hypothetical protein
MGAGQPAPYYKEIRVKYRMRRMDRFDKMAEDIYRFLRDDDRKSAMAALAEILQIDQELRRRLSKAKRMLKVS